MATVEKKPPKPTKVYKRLTPKQQRLKVLREPLWEMQPGESFKAYGAFRIYRDLGSQRTLTRVAEMIGHTGAKRWGPVSAGEWSQRWRWVERARAYDAYLDTKALAVAEQRERQMAGTWASRRNQIQEREFTLASGIAEKVEEFLKYPTRLVTRKRTVDTKSGQVTLVTIINPADWSWATLAPLLREFSRTSRLAAGMVTEGARAPTPETTEGALSDVDAYMASMVEAAEEMALIEEEA